MAFSNNTLSLPPSLFPIPLAVLGGIKGIAVSVVYTLSVQTKGSE